MTPTGIATHSKAGLRPATSASGAECVDTTVWFSDGWVGSRSSVDDAARLGGRAELGSRRAEWWSTPVLLKWGATVPGGGTGGIEPARWVGVVDEFGVAAGG